MSFGELDSLFEQFFALVEATVRLPPGTKRRSAFRDIRDYGSRIDQIAVQLLEQRPDLNSGRPHPRINDRAGLPENDSRRQAPRRSAQC